MLKRGWLFLLTVLLTCGLWTGVGESLAISVETNPMREINLWNITITYRDLVKGKKGKLPVYTAPFEDAWRGANGKAYVSTSEKFSLLGAARNQTWLWVEYSTGGKNRRTGWIQTDAQLPEDYYDLFPNDGRPLRVTRDTALTDDPRGGQRTIKTLQAGEEVIGLGRMAESSGLEGWIYVETEIDGKPAWGFLREGRTEEIPTIEIRGDTICYIDGVTDISTAFEFYDDKGNPVEEYRDILQLRTGRIYGEEVGESFREHFWEMKRIEYPQTLEILGEGAIWGGTWEEIVFPRSLRLCSSDAIVDATIGKVVIPKEYTGTAFFHSICTIGAFEVEEGNPLYKSVDGVLYSADGKTLLRYPNGKTDVHLDVQPGVEVIWKEAFSDYQFECTSGIPLKTISLPMGLKEIGENAFSGCFWLQSLTVPLTVTKIGAGAFDKCFSLERLSLPPGLMTEYHQKGLQQGGFTTYNGDNGQTTGFPAIQTEE